MTCVIHGKRRSWRRQSGLSLATALFVITVMALLAVLITQLIRNNAETTQEEIQLIRAFYAAQSGVQYGLNRAFPPNGDMTACPATFTPPTITADGLNQCVVQVQCDVLTVSGDPYYTITSQGTCGGVSRTVQVRAQ